VLCNQATTQFVYKGEEPTCTYTFELWVTGNCAFIPPIPSFEVNSQSGSNMEITIKDDTHLWAIPFLTSSYQLKLDGKLKYHGVYRVAEIGDLPVEEYHLIQVEGIYNGMPSGFSPNISVKSIQENSTESRKIEEKIDVLGLQLTQMDTQIEARVGKIEEQISIEVVTVVEQIEQQNIQLNDQLNKVSQQVSSPRTESSGMGFLGLGIVVGIILGIILTVVGIKVLPNIELPKFLSSGRFGKYSAAPMLGDE